MDSLPAPILAHICLLLPQQDLASLASTSRFLHPIALEALYQKVTVVDGATNPLGISDSALIREVSGGQNGSIVLDPESCEMLLQALEKKAGLVKHFTIEAVDVTELQSHFVEVLKNLPLRTFRMDPPVLATGDRLTHTIVNSMDQLKQAFSHFSTIEVQLAKITTGVPIPSSSVLQHLSCSSQDHQGLEVLAHMDPEEKLQLASLSISHLHDDAAPLDFSSIASSIDISQLSKLRLHVDCHQLGCACYSKFFDSLASFAAENGGLPRLKSVEIEAFPQDDWLRPVEMLELKLEPLSAFLKQLTGLEELMLDFATPCLKMTGDSETSISDANKINRRLADAFFLSMFEKPDFGRRLRRLEIPDFLASFAYYKSEFRGSMLQSCPCHGCNEILEELSLKVHTEIAQEDPDVDESQVLYLVMYAILFKLQSEKLVSLGVNTHYTLSLLKADSSDWIAEHFSSCTVSEQALKTYIAHQLQPMKRYFIRIFENLTRLNLHGIYFEKGADMVSVFHNENYT